ncbi:RHS repeat-associated core domain-containing protein [Pseudomonas putida]|uniref:RHS repeat-associated core domain-containing protein n=1 Tax=Pseudomonas putida TaxID=303 RepID=UPI00300F298B
MAKLFYQNGKLITLKKHEYSHSVFRTNNHIFAQSSTDITQQLELFAIDTKNSILCAHASLAREEHAYTAFGYSAKLPSTRTLQGFNGEFFNELLGAYQLGLGFRTFSPELMRFQSPDNLSPFGVGGLNVYAYGKNDPINTVDRSGHAPTPIIRPTAKPLPSRLVHAWTRSQRSGWTGILSEEKILSTIQQYLPSRDVTTLASLAPNSGLTVMRNSNKLANARITSENILEVSDALNSGTFNMNGVTVDSASTRAHDVVQARLRALYDDSGNPREGRGRRIFISERDESIRENSVSAP